MPLRLPRLVQFEGIFSVLKWSLAALADKEFPTERHDGAAFGDTRRQGMSGKALSVRGAVVQVKGDWAELEHTPGLFLLGTVSYTHLTLPTNREV